MRPYIVQIPASHKGPGATELVTIDLDHVQEMLHPRIVRGSCRVPFWQWGYKLAFSREFQECRAHFQHYRVVRVHDDLTVMTDDPQYIEEPDPQQAIQAAIDDIVAPPLKARRAVFQVNGEFYADPEHFSPEVSELYEAQTKELSEPFLEMYEAWMTQPQMKLPPNPGPHEHKEDEQDSCSCETPRAGLGGKLCTRCGGKISLRTPDS